MCSIVQVSAACVGLCQWVLALEVYERVAKVVAPKKEKLKIAEAELAVQMRKLEGKRAELKEVVDKLQALKDELDAMVRKKDELESNIDLCAKKLDRAEKLIGAYFGATLATYQSDLTTYYGLHFRWFGWREDALE